MNHKCLTKFVRESLGTRPPADEMVRSISVVALLVALLPALASGEAPALTQADFDQKVFDDGKVCMARCVVAQQRCQ